MANHTKTPENLRPEDLVPAVHGALRALAHPRAPHAVDTLAARVPPLFPAGPSPAAMRRALGRGQERLEAALYDLVSSSLLSFDPTPPGRYTVHRLTRTFLRRRVFAPEPVEACE